jgi:hypothetical protein
MPRQRRLEIANGVFHVTNRGLERRDIALDERDRRTWLRLLGRVATRQAGVRSSEFQFCREETVASSASEA